jgi:hypothetical protein
VLAGQVAAMIGLKHIRQAADWPGRHVLAPDR